MRRAAVIVLDACGVGALPDAADYAGDAGSNTLAHLADRVGGLELPTLQRLGLGSILPLRGVPPSDDPVMHGRLAPLGPGKESTTGHWELMGVVPSAPLPTYPDGFPPGVIEALERATGRRFCCNRPYSGTEVLEDYGEHHLRTGELILYTSADSVLQIAAHVDVLDEPGLYAVCEAAREVMDGEHGVGRVIARPFEGKIRDLFAGVGISEKHDGATNAKGIAATTGLLRELDGGLIFVNLVETDQVYGHRHDVEGFHAALREIDAAVGGWLDLLGPDDLLVLTADHGVDPDAPHTDHTREYAPLLARFEGDGGRRHDGPLADVGASVLRWLTGRAAPELPGEPFV
jgi:phosphopentomutase